jgi:hypothetical protein
MTATSVSAAAEARDKQAQELRRLYDAGATSRTWSTCPRCPTAPS